MKLENPVKILPCAYCASAEKLTLFDTILNSITYYFVYCQKCKASGPIHRLKKGAVRLFCKRAVFDDEDYVDFELK